MLFPSRKDTSTFCMTAFAMLLAPWFGEPLVSKQNFHSKGVGSPTGDSGSRVTARHVELGLLAIPGSWARTTRTKRMEIRIGHNTRVFRCVSFFLNVFLIGFVDRECCRCCLFLFFFRRGNCDMICGDVWAGVVGWESAEVPHCQHLPAGALQKTSIKHEDETHQFDPLKTYL